MEINKDEIWMYESVFGKDYFHSYYKDDVIFDLNGLLDNCPYEFYLSERYLSIYQPEYLILAKYYGEKYYKLSIREAFQLFHIYFLVLKLLYYKPRNRQKLYKE